MGSYLNHPRGENDRLWAGACYVAPLALSMMGVHYLSWMVNIVALVGVRPLSPWLRFHAIQSLVLSLITLGIYVVGVFVLLVAYILIFVMVGIIFIPVAVLILMIAMSVSIDSLVIGIMVFSETDHRVPFLADWVERNYV